jgi:hypothetical protein
VATTEQHFGGGRREANYQIACEEVRAHLAYGTPLSELLQMVGLDSSVLNKKQSSPPPPPAQAPAKPAPPKPAAAKAVVFVEPPEKLRNVAAYILWEQAGNPDGADFGAEAIVRLAFGSHPLRRPLGAVCLCDRTG